MFFKSSNFRFRQVSQNFDSYFCSLWNVIFSHFLQIFHIFVHCEMWHFTFFANFSYFLFTVKCDIFTNFSHSGFLWNEIISHFCYLTKFLYFCSLYTCNRYFHIFFSHFRVLHSGFDRWWKSTFDVFYYESKMKVYILLQNFV